MALGGGGGEGGAGTGRRAAAGDREARIQEGRGVLGVLLQVGAFNIENAPRCILVPPYIYILGECPCVATEPYNNTITYVHIGMCSCVATEVKN